MKHTMRGNLSARIAVLAIAGLAVGSTASRADNAEQLKDTCPKLAGQTVPAASIGLPSGNAAVVSAAFTAAAPPNPDFCKVTGSIAPVDPAAQAINFQINLPIAWNGKALQYGGGGYNGSLTTGLAPLRDAAPGDPTPLARGYVTFGTDAGHQAASFAPNAIGQFGLNDEMLVNYAYASYKKVRDVASSITRSFYGRPPSKLYYFGGSEGGREGLTMAQRFPADYDGVVSIVPVVQLSMLFQSYIHHQQPQLRGGWLSAAKTRTLAKYVVDRCDTLDGVADGVISNYLACGAHIRLKELRCPGGAEGGDGCLSDLQIAAVAAVHAPYDMPFAGANGISSYPQWLYGNETNPDPRIFGANTRPDPDATTMQRWVVGTAAPTAAVDVNTASQHWLYGANFVRFFVTKDASYDAAKYDPAKFRARVLEMSALIDSTNPDLSAFFGHGGKLIMRENMGDLAQSPLAGINYFNSVIAKLGRDKVDQSARLYVSPASTHTGTAASVLDGSPVPTMVDLLDPLDQWVSEGKAPPDSLIQTVKTTTPPYNVLATRPMCRYPNYPHYQGGDRLQADSYRCMPSKP